jgi:N-formylmaleamate deformylase
MSSTFLYGANIHANGIRQHYLRYGGRGQPLVLVPGITSPAPTWGFVAERLGAHYDVHVLDVRGRGLSETGSELDYSREAYAADVGAFAQALKLADYVYLGHSMGARIGCLVGRKHGARIASMILVDPPMSGPGRAPYPAALEWYIDSIRLSAKGIGADEMRAFCPTWRDEDLRIRAEWLHTCNEAAIVRSFHDLNLDDIHVDMPCLSMPILLVAAGRGGVITSADMAEVRRLIPQLRISVVENAGHMIPYENESGFFSALSEFLGPKF